LGSSAKMGTTHSWHPKGLLRIPKRVFKPDVVCSVCHTTTTQKLFCLMSSLGWATRTGRLLGLKMGNSINSMFTWAKQKWFFWKIGFYPANQSNLKSIQKASIGWKKAGPPKKSR